MEKLHDARNINQAFTRLQTCGLLCYSVIREKLTSRAFQTLLQFFPPSDGRNRFLPKGFNNTSLKENIILQTVATTFSCMLRILI